MQDVEFTIEHGKLYMLQTRDGKRTARATIRIAVEMADEGVISKQEAVLRVKPDHVLQLLHRSSTTTTEARLERKRYLASASMPRPAHPLRLRF